MRWSKKWHLFLRTASFTKSKIKAPSSFWNNAPRFKLPFGYWITYPVFPYEHNLRLSADLLLSFFIIVFFFVLTLFIICLYFEYKNDTIIFLYSCWNEEIIVHLVIKCTVIEMLPKKVEEPFAKVWGIDYVKR